MDSIGFGSIKQGVDRAGATSCRVGDLFYFAARSDTMETSQSGGRAITIFAGHCAMVHSSDESQSRILPAFLYLRALHAIFYQGFGALSTLVLFYSHPAGRYVAMDYFNV